MRFDEIWTSERQLKVLASLAITTQGMPGEVIEIGTHQGLSAIPIAHAIFPDILHVVDHWRGSSDMSPESKNRDNYDIFLQNIDQAGLGGTIYAHKQDWREFALFWTEPIRFLYLDAEHTQEEVSDQIDVFLPYAHGIIAGDDWSWTGVQLAVQAHFQPAEINTLLDKLWWISIP